MFLTEFLRQKSAEEIEAGINIVDVLNETGFLKSNGEARRALTANSISVNRENYRRICAF
jgi:ribosome-associated protein YbcJ (S4-like RNA binding protein)